MSNNQVFECQKCDTPLNLDQSLLNLNESQLKLLVSQKKHKLFRKANSQILKDLDPQDYIPQDRLEMYQTTETILKVRMMKMMNMKMKNRIINNKNYMTLVSLLTPIPI